MDVAPTSSLLDVLTALGSLATPIIVLALTVIGWRYKTRLQRSLDIEEKLREDRVSIYQDILEPFIIILLPDASQKGTQKRTDMAVRRMYSLDYRKVGFRLALIGSDSVVKSYNNLMQYFFERAQHHTDEEEAEFDVVKVMNLLGIFLLEIRKSMGNEGTQLTSLDMLEWFLTDARKYSDQL